MRSADLSYGVQAARHGRSTYIRRLLKQPLVFGAALRIDSLPQQQLVQLAGTGARSVRLTPIDDRHDWSLGAAEQLALQLIMIERSIERVFEIGTFNGATSALMAETMPERGKVVTVDLPDDAFTSTQHPESFTAADVGAAHRRSPASHKITQLRTDSLDLDVEPYRNWADLVLVDGAHDYEHGFADTRSALAIAKPGGLIVWDDFEPYWHGLVHGVLDAARNLPVARIAGLPIAVLEVK